MIQSPNRASSPPTPYIDNHPRTDEKQPIFVAVHCGAGYHSKRYRPELVKVCRKACLAVLNASKNSDCTSLSACTSAIVMLENSPITNAGKGSNLTQDQTIECDAGLAHCDRDASSATFAGIGAVSGVRNPIRVAELLLDYQRQHRVSSLVPPSFLVGAGAQQFAASNGCDMCPEQDLITENSRSGQKRALSDLASMDSASSIQKNERFDTVGAVVITADGDAAAGCSSGGLLLKLSGRVGHSSVFGCGCWVVHQGFISVGVATSGCGEHLVRTQFAMQLANHITLEMDRERNSPLADIVRIFLRTGFTKSELLAGLPDSQKIAGAVVIVLDKKQRCCEILWLHNSRTFCIGYGSRTGDGIRVESFTSQHCGDSNKELDFMISSDYFKF